MRIALISNKTPDYQSGGIERFLHEMIGALTESEIEVESHLCAPGSHGTAPYPLQGYDGAIFAGSAPMYLSCGDALHDLARSLSCPKILAMVFPFGEVEFYLGRRTAARCAREVARLGSLVQSVVVPSGYARGDFASWCPNLVPPVVIPHGGGRSGRQDARSARHAFRLVSVARAGPLAVHKNMDAVAGAMAAVRRIRPRAELLLMGRGTHGAEFSSAGVRHLGAVSEESRIDLVRSARAMVLPSAIESFGLSVVESLGLGTPVVALNATAVPELVRHERNGLLIDPVRHARFVDGERIPWLRPDEASLVDSLLRVLSPDLPWEGMSGAAVLTAREFSWNRTAERYLRLLRGA